jgi:hypothetical protein
MKTWASGRNFIGLKAAAAALKDFLGASAAVGVGEGAVVEMGGGGFTSLLLLLPLALASAGRGAAVPLVLLIWASRSGLLLPSRPREVVS